mmetsp:Transcript_53130/g.147855  ORF Transcript_53130/g.147855 Transcript_53130/m.147855 type:complete len:281 (+) Transcript_53130:580-1422(+)
MAAELRLAEIVLVCAALVRNRLRRNSLTWAAVAGWSLEGHGRRAWRTSTGGYHRWRRPSWRAHTWRSRGRRHPRRHHQRDVLRRSGVGRLHAHGRPRNAAALSHVLHASAGRLRSRLPIEPRRRHAQRRRLREAHHGCRLAHVLDLTAAGASAFAGTRHGLGVWRLWRALGDARQARRTFRGHACSWRCAHRSWRHAPWHSSTWRSPRLRHHAGQPGRARHHPWHPRHPRRPKYPGHPRHAGHSGYPRRAGHSGHPKRTGHRRARRRSFRGRTGLSRRSP